MNLPFARFVELVEVCAKARREELRRLAFVGWQVHAAMGGTLTWQEYQHALGLDDDETQAEHVGKEEALDRAKSALERLTSSGWRVEVLEEDAA
ncbi:MAG: hypothetical protein HPY55_15875 [Firmicutes bacterium]|nr:hypothetical protein [Bacillota bacterium]